MKVGEEWVRTIRHFWPKFNSWLDEVPDSRFFPYVVYDKRFLIWWGINLFTFQLGSRRQLDFELDAEGTQVLRNLNRLAGTKQTTRPVHKTLHHFVGHTGASPYAVVRTHMIDRLLRMKALDAARLQGHVVVALDATGHLSFRTRHCPYCLEQRHDTHTCYLHQVLEAKLLGPANMALSMASEFIENRDDNPTVGAEARKQDCELKALSRLLPKLRGDFPQVRICLAGDGLYACGRSFQLAREYRCTYVFTFKAGHMPAVWADFQALLPLCPQNYLERTTPAGAHQWYRWVENISYQDDQKRTWTFHAILCEETVDGQTTTFAWLTDLRVNARTVADIATKGGRARWHIENQGFNRQKNSGLNLEHAFCTDPELLPAYYYLLQIAHIMLQVFEAGSLLRHLIADGNRTVAQVFGSLKNLARRLLDSFRYFVLGDAVFADSGGRIQIRFDSS